MSETNHRHAPDGLILLIACLAQFMVVLDVSIVNVALPHMGRDLHFTTSSAQWVVNAYVLTYAGFLLLGGRGADFFGRRHAYLTGITIFTLASIAAGFATTGTEMVAARAIQGIGGAILSPATLTIIVTTFHGPRLPKAIGAWSAVAGAGGAVGGLLGGILTGWVSWRWVFFINVPFGILAFTLASMYLREMRNKDATAKLDYTGAIVVTGALFAGIYGIVNTTTHAWLSSFTLSWIGIGIVGLAFFVFWEMRVASHPLVPFRLFRKRALTTANIVMLFVGGVFFVIWYFLTFYFQFILGYGPVKAGFAFLPMALSIIIGAQLSSRLLPKAGVRPLVVLGSVFAAVGFFLLSLLKDNSGYGSAIILPAILCALGMGLTFAPLANAATADVDRADAGLASGLLNTARQLGGSLSLAILGTVAADRTAVLLQHDTPNRVALVAGYSRGFAISGTVIALAILIAITFPGHVGRHKVESAKS
jgi:EmrB/QacA subfamily drug resistance transporter